MVIAAVGGSGAGAQQAQPVPDPPAAAGPEKPPGGRYDYLAVRLAGGPSNVSGAKNVGTRAGTVTNQKDDDLIGGAGAALGFDWQKFGWPVRSEIEYNLDYRFDYNARPPLSSNAGNGLENNLRTHTLMLNAYYDIKNRTRWTPYVGVGVGLARNESEGIFTVLATGSKQTLTTVVNNLAWSVGTGVRYAWSERWSIEVGYRFVNLGKFKTGPFADGTAIQLDKYYKHDLFIGAVFHF
jgi:opacity protein-like surface antigen